MSRITFFSTHSGAGGACLGARDAGLLPLGGIEIDSYCVDLHRANFGDGIRHESILDTVTEELPDFDFLWTSPSCQSFSTAKTDGKELELDIAIAYKIAEIIRVKKPKYFALENVRGYLGSESFEAILNEIKSQGYNHHHAVYDVADYGVPQNRHRLILRASREPLHDLPQTHSKTGGLWWKPWEGWYDAIADLLPSCKPSHLTERQIQALEKKGWYGEITKGLVVKSDYLESWGAVGRSEELPIGTVTGQSKPKAVLVEGEDSPSRDRTLHNPEEPYMTIAANQCGGERSPKAVLMQEMKALHQEIQSYEQNSGDRDHSVRERLDELRHEAEKLQQSPKAVLVDCKGNRYFSTFTAVNEDSPSYSIRASAAHQCRAVIIERTGYRNDRDPMIRDADEPSQTIRAAVGCDERGGYRSPITALLEQADVRALDYRCLARLQSFPDGYKWGKSAGKNCKAIGNAVPSLFAQKVIESIVGRYNDL